MYIRNVVLRQFIAVIMVLCLLAGSCFAVIGIQKFVPTIHLESLKITVMSDPCVIPAEISDVNNPDYAKMAKNKISYVPIADAVFKSAIDNFIGGDNEVLVITGGLTADGSIYSHEYIAKELKRVEDAGKRVFVTNSEEDTGMRHAYDYSHAPISEIPTATIEDFAEIYEDFGFSEAESRHEDSLSYSCDINDYYSLLVIDTCSDEALDEEDALAPSVLIWAIKEAEAIRRRGRTPIAVTHLPLVQHLGRAVESFKISGTSLENKEFVAGELIDSGVGVVFTGHMHAQDIAQTEIPGKGVLYDVETCSISAYPAAMREVELLSDKTMNIKTVTLKKINSYYIADFIDKDYKQRMAEDFSKFCYDNLQSNMYEYLTVNFTPATLSEAIMSLGIKEGHRTEIDALSEDTIELIRSFYNMPVYGAEGSLESIMAQYGIAIPQLNYKTISEMILTPLRENFRGDENMTGDLMTLIKYAIYALIYSVADDHITERLHEIDADFPEFNLMPAMERLFTEGKLYTGEIELLKKLMSIPLIKEELKMLSSVTTEKGAFETLEWFLSVWTFEDIRFDKYVDSDECSIDVNSLINEVVYGNLAKDFITDFGASDNDITIDLKNMQWKDLF